MRRSINGPRSASTAASLAIKQGSMARRAVSTDENNQNCNKGGKSLVEEAQFGFSSSGPVTARLKSLEKRFSQLLELQAKFQIIDKWIQQQFCISLFPPSVVNSEKFAEGNPDDADNPFYAVYLAIQRIRLLEEKVKKLESRPMEEMYELKPTSNYSSAHAFRNFKGKPGTVSGGVKRTYGGSGGSPATTPKKAKLVSRPAPQTSNYPFKPSVKILPKNSNAASPVKKENKQPNKDASPVKQSHETESVVIKQEQGEVNDVPSKKDEVSNIADNSNNVNDKPDKDSGLTEALSQSATESAPNVGNNISNNANADSSINVQNQEKESEGKEVGNLEMEIQNQASSKKTNDGQIEAVDIKVEVEDSNSGKEDEDKAGEEEIGDIPILEVSTAPLDEADMEVDDSGQEDEMEMKSELPIEEEVGGGDVSGSEASVSSLASSSSRPRQSTRRQAAAVIASSSTLENADEKPVMYTTRGRRHTVPRRYAEFTGHDNVVSILKSQQRAERSSSGRPGRKPGSSSKNQDAPPRIKKMVKGTPKTPPKKTMAQQESDGEDYIASPNKKKSGSNAGLPDRPACVDALVERVMAREVDDDGMVQLTESFPNIYVNQQQLVAVIVRSNGKATRLTRKMTTLVFEDSLLASASPFGTKYYKDRLPPEPLEAMVDFIADSGFEPHYTKKKIYMIVGQVCNEARAGRVSKKFMQPLEDAPGPSDMQQVEEEEEEDEMDEAIDSALAPDSPPVVEDETPE